MAKTELIGLEEVEQILNKLPGEVQRKILTSALRNSAKPVLNAAKINISTARGGNKLTENIKIRSKKKSAAKPGVNVGYFPTKAKTAWEAMGGLWLEFGTMEFMTRPRSRKTRPLSDAQRKVGPPPSKRGRTQPIAWLRRATDANEKQIIEGFRKVLWDGMNKFFRRYARKLNIR